MILIADSGSTKTDWCTVDEQGQTKTIQSIGINPYYMNEAGIKEVLDKELIPFLNPETIKEIHYYGAGCSTEQKCGLVGSVLQASFKNATVEVNHDMLGAARALCDHKPGIACILGTGSNSCSFNGKEITENAISLGYLLGDEGSGAYLGKKLLTDYFHGRMPQNIQQFFHNEYNLSLETALDNMYNKPKPNRYLASFSKFISKYREEEYLKEMVLNSFDDFFRISVSKYKDYKTLDVNFLGSVAYYFSDLLRITAGKYGVTIGNIYRSPMEGLVLYHTDYQ